MNIFQFQLIQVSNLFEIEVDIQYKKVHTLTQLQFLNLTFAKLYSGPRFFLPQREEQQIWRMLKMKSIQDSVMIEFMGLELFSERIQPSRCRSREYYWHLPQEGDVQTKWLRLILTDISEYFHIMEPHISIRISVSCFHHIFCDLGWSFDSDLHIYILICSAHLKIHILYTWMSNV